MRSLITVLASLLLLPGQVPAQAPTVSTQLLLARDRFAPGAAVRVAVVIDLTAPWHINANPPTLPELIPTVVTFEAPGLAFGKITYPKGKEERVEWAEQPVALYSGRATIFAEGEVSGDAPPGPVTIRATVRYQACDNTVCYAPKTIELTAAGTVDASGGGAELHPEIFGAVAPAGSATGNSIEQLIAQRGWLVALVFVFLGGLALNLTPCVYPMIAITVSYFGGQGERTTGRAFRHALVYFFGVTLTYSVLGLIAALTGGLFGAVLQSPVMLIIIAVLLIALALSMFGLYEIQPPQFLMKKATGLSSKAGYVGVFFLGAMVGVIAAPCLAPILVALLVFVGQRGDPWLGWWMFFVLACGLGLPYVVLGTYSGALGRLPKSGTWMVWVKRVFGVVLILVAIWFVRPLFAGKTETASPIAWQKYSPEAVANAGKPVLIDFYADWCIPCHEMDKRTFADPRVIEKTRELLMLKADLTRTGTPETDKLAQEYKILGVPTFVFMDATGRERAELRQVGFVNADAFLALMNRALAPPVTNAAAQSGKPPGLMQPL
jgi:thiol:disulfide interchange protein DsbD